ncbi:MAG: hypothetical protein V4547_16565 [Bacteroidota bacterium]
MNKKEYNLTVEAFWLSQPMKERTNFMINNKLTEAYPTWFDITLEIKIQFYKYMRTPRPDMELVNMFTAFKCFINANFEPEQTTQIWRRQLIEQLRQYPTKNQWTDQGIDVYRCFFKAAGYFKTVGHGVYEIVKPVPASLSLNELKAKAYPPKHEPMTHMGKEIVTDNSLAS